MLSPTREESIDVIDQTHPRCQPSARGTAEQRPAPGPKNREAREHADEPESDLELAHEHTPEPHHPAGRPADEVDLAQN